MRRSYGALGAIENSDNSKVMKAIDFVKNPEKYEIPMAAPGQAVSGGISKPDIPQQTNPALNLMHVMSDNGGKKGFDQNVQSCFLQQCFLQGNSLTGSGGASGAAKIIVPSGVNVPGNTVLQSLSVSLQVKTLAKALINAPCSADTSVFDWNPWFGSGANINHYREWPTTQSYIMPPIDYVGVRDLVGAGQTSTSGSVLGPYGYGRFIPENYPSVDAAPKVFIPNTLTPIASPGQGATQSVLINAADQVTIAPALDVNFSLARLVNGKIEFTAGGQPAGNVLMTGTTSAGVLSDRRARNWPHDQIAQQALAKPVYMQPIQQGVVNLLGPWVVNSLQPVNPGEALQPYSARDPKPIYGPKEFGATGVSIQSLVNGTYVAGSTTITATGFNDSVVTCAVKCLWTSSTHTSDAHYLKVRELSPAAAFTIDSAASDLASYGINSYPQESLTSVSSTGTTSILAADTPIENILLPLTVNGAPYEYRLTFQDKFGTNNCFSFGSCCHVFASANYDGTLNTSFVTEGLGTSGFIYPAGAPNTSKANPGTTVEYVCGATEKTWNVTVKVPLNPNGTPVIGPSYLGTYWFLMGNPNGIHTVTMTVSAAGLYNTGVLGPSWLTRVAGLGAGMDFNVSGQLVAQCVATQNISSFLGGQGNQNFSVKGSTIELAESLFSSPMCPYLAFMMTKTDWLHIGKAVIMNLANFRDWIIWVLEMFKNDSRVSHFAEGAWNTYRILHGKQADLANGVFGDTDDSSAQTAMIEQLHHELEDLKQAHEETDNKQQALEEKTGQIAENQKDLAQVTQKVAQGQQKLAAATQQAVEDVKDQVASAAPVKAAGRYGAGDGMFGAGDGMFGANGAFGASGKKYGALGFSDLNSPFSSMLMDAAKSYAMKRASKADGAYAPDDDDEYQALGFGDIFGGIADVAKGVAGAAANVAQTVAPIALQAAPMLLAAADGIYAPTPDPNGWAATKKNLSDVCSYIFQPGYLQKRFGLEARPVANIYGSKGTLLFTPIPLMEYLTNISRNQALMGAINRKYQGLLHQFLTGFQEAATAHGAEIPFKQVKVPPGKPNRYTLVREFYTNSVIVQATAMSQHRGELSVPITKLQYDGAFHKNFKPGSTEYAHCQSLLDLELWPRKLVNAVETIISRITEGMKSGKPYDVSRNWLGDYRSPAFATPLIEGTMNRYKDKYIHAKRIERAQDYNRRLNASRMGANLEPLDFGLENSEDEEGVPNAGSVRKRASAPGGKGARLEGK